jgi:hypothetical protein
MDGEAAGLEEWIPTDLRPNCNEPFLLQPVNDGALCHASADLVCSLAFKSKGSVNSWIEFTLPFIYVFIIRGLFSRIQILYNSFQAADQFKSFLCRYSFIVITHIFEEVVAHAFNVNSYTGERSFCKRRNTDTTV